MNQPITSQKIISASLLRLRMRSPFFATLALFAKFIPTPDIPTAATDGKDIFFNPDFLQSLSAPQQDGILLHEVLHAALLHFLRRGVREKETWNIAADIVVNGIICQQGCFELPEGGIRDPKLEHLSVEEIYELLPQQDCSHCLSILDLLDNAPAGNADEKRLASPGQISSKFDSLSEAKKAELESHWQNAMQQATVIARTSNQGNLPAGMIKELGALDRSQLDWRSYLWRYLVKTPTDYTEFDRRFIGRGLYLETLQGESVKVYVAVDTSGSIDEQLLKMFLSEVKGILNSYPHLECELYYADADVYGAYELNPDSDIPQPQGGGGTSFVPFFSKVSHGWDGMTTAVCVYLTDGYGTFPDTAPELPVLWVVTPGGLDLSQFPFGETVRLLSI
ncbi:vWA domain-containing protein [Pleurocapsa sp. FMAR1]|uniref:vWA domain-containing protein n=1 Tax=Pleurocapsa sp. FMAR1 TaxID=3040204 RepID=UPI0029C65394|nr:VWA-like domain-containing protein [Pleurocapsa sp. FMAR1]